MTRHLHEGFMGTAVRAKYGRNADYPFTSDNGDLRPASCAAAANGDDRSQSSINEANLVYPTVGCLQALSKIQSDWFEVRLHKLTIPVREVAQDPVVRP